MTTPIPQERTILPRHDEGGEAMPKGAVLLPDYIDQESEAGLLAAIDHAPWSEELRRRVQHHGWRYDYKARRVTKESRLGPLPNWLQRLATRLYRDRLFAAVPDQVIVNEYLPGQGIAPHVDCVPCFGGVIASLSLGGDCTMTLARRDGPDRRDLRLTRRSLLVLSDEARHAWTHAIPARKSDMIDGQRVPRARRVSLTFRTVRLDEDQ